MEEYFQNKLSSRHWQRFGSQNAHGIAISLGSLHSQNSCGIGEFLDLIPLIDWCSEIGFKVIQLLPLNDSGSDSSCYNALSSLALNPIFLSFHALPYVNESTDLPQLEDLRLSLSAEDRFDYSKVKTHKLAWLREYFRLYYDIISEQDDYKQFITENTWLKPYGLFKVLKDILEQTSFLDWPLYLKSPSPEEYEALLTTHEASITFYCFLQYLCYSQLRRVKTYANQRFLYIKGDIPILINRDSVDVWFYPNLFDLSLAAGAPPDAYNQEGQYWGFPIYRWDNMKISHFEWWLTRLNYASFFYDLYRIDHVIGFFRIWAIPLNHAPIEGAFIPPDQKDWYPQGRELLEMMLRATDMLPIAENLGLVPAECNTCLNELGICGTQVMRWEKRYDLDQRFTPIEEYPVLNMTCVSTHDSETLAQWWVEYPDEARQYCHDNGWEYIPTLSREYRFRILWQSHHTTSIFHINLLQEYLALFDELVWPDLSSERINVPGTVNDRNWTYRMRPSIEEIIGHAGLKSYCVNIIAKKEGNA